MLARPLATSRRSMKQHCPSSLPERCVVASAAWPTCLQQHQAVPPQRNGACSAASTRARPVRDTITSSLRRPAHAPSRPGPPLCASSSPTAVPHAHQQQEQGASIGGKQQLTWMTCKRCKQRFAAEQNHRTACRSGGGAGGERASTGWLSGAVGCGAGACKTRNKAVAVRIAQGCGTGHGALARAPGMRHVHSLWLVKAVHR